MSSLEFEEGLTNFTFEAYGVIPKNGNEIFSPFSLSAALLLLMVGSNGTTKSKMTKSVFRNTIPTDIHGNYKILSDKLASRKNDGVTLNVANRLFGQKIYKIVESFTANALQYYGSELELLDFINSPEPSKERINSWISAKTNNMIRNMLPSGLLNRDTVMILVNAVYFKGKWSVQFKPQETKKKTFYVNKNMQKQVDMMNSDRNALVGYNYELGCKVLKLPYSGDELSMIFVLPDSIDGLAQLENKLDASVFKKLLGSVYLQESYISIPKFDIKSSYDLKSILSNLGMSEIFDQNKADFGAMIKPPPKVYISYARQDAIIEVTEEGTRAAAVTVFQAIATSVRVKPVPFIFNANHPFLFFIVDNISNIILFMGRYANP